MNKTRLIVTFDEGEFMLLKDFNSSAEALEYARLVGFSTYEITTDYKAEDWVAIDPTIQEPKMSFAYNKNRMKSYHF